MPIRAIITTAVLVALGGFITGATRSEERDVERTPTAGVILRDTEVLRLKSRHVRQEFELWVARPRPSLMRPLPERYGVLWVLDGDLFFGTAVEMTRLMHQLFMELPPLLVVGVSYGVDAATQSELRNRDFTPTADESFVEMGRQMRPGWEPLLPEGERTGGAPAFLRFLREEARPLIEERYPVRGQEQVVFGSSLGGLFTAWVARTAPRSFDHYVIASPALWWDEETVLDLPLPEGRPSGLFLGVGALEELPGVPWAERFRLVTNTRRFADQAGSTAHVFDDESHTTVVPVVLTRGLRALVGGRP